MWKRLFDLIKIYIGFVVVFALQKPLFMLYHLDLYKEAVLKEWLTVIGKGLPLD